MTLLTDLATVRHAPYRNSDANDIYQLLFADDPQAFAPAAGSTPAAWQATLLGAGAVARDIRQLAEDGRQDSRVRALAFQWLRARGEAVPAKVLLGVVVEVALDEGLDALAAYTDGSVRYLHHDGHMSLFEGPLPALQPHVQEVLVAAETIVSRIGPWDKPRLPPPVTGHIRLSFLVSDGLYFGEGPASALAGDGLAGPLIQRATALLQQVVALDAQADQR
jgi:hypothetical protein